MHYAVCKCVIYFYVSKWLMLFGCKVIVSLYCYKSDCKSKKYKKEGSIVQRPVLKHCAQYLVNLCNGAERIVDAFPFWKATPCSTEILTC